LKHLLSLALLRLQKST